MEANKNQERTSGLEEKDKKNGSKEKKRGLISRIRNSIMSVRFIKSEELETYEAIISNARASKEYYLLLVFSCLIALFGLYQNSPATIIGAMIVAPLLGPIMGFSAAVLWGDAKNILGSVLALAKGVAIVLAITSGLSFFIPGLSVNSEIAARANPGFYDLVIAVSCGLIGAYGAANKKVSASLTGVAISVALMPPLCTIGIGIGLLDLGIATRASLLFAINLLGISLGSIVIFYLEKLYPRHFDEDEKTGVAKRALGQILLSLALVAGICFILLYYSYAAVESIRLKNTASSVLSGNIGDASIYSLDIKSAQEGVSLTCILLAGSDSFHADVKSIENEIASSIGKRATLLIYVIDKQVD